MKYASFDLEVALEIPEGADWDELGPLGISCVGLAFSDTKEIRYWHAPGQLSKDECKQVVRDFQGYVDEGYTFLSWNGLKFDFKVLAQESGLWNACSRLALKHHVDMMLYVTFVKGWYLGLQTALVGAGCPGKLKEVTLSTGEVVQGMEGSQAPALWKAGEYDAVLAYLREDVIQPLCLIEYIEKEREITWTSNAGNLQYVPVPEMLLAHECFDLPLPDTSWMDNPPTRESFVQWVTPKFKRELNL